MDKIKSILRNPYTPVVCFAVLLAFMISFKLVAAPMCPAPIEGSIISQQTGEPPIILDIPTCCDDVPLDELLYVFTDDDYHPKRSYSM